jgi:hypothetical protein
MPHLESREAERRVKVLLFSSMVGVLVGLIVATFMESEHRAPPPAHPVPGLNDQSNEPHDLINETNVRGKRFHA